MKNYLLRASAALLTSAVALSQSTENLILPQITQTPFGGLEWGSGVAAHGDWMVMGRGAGYTAKPQVFRRLVHSDTWVFHQELDVAVPADIGSVNNHLPIDPYYEMHAGRVVVRSGVGIASRIVTFQYFGTLDLWVGVGELVPPTYGEGFAVSIDLSEDGSRLVATQQGLALIHIYEWDVQLGWQSEAIVGAPPSAQAFGTSAAIDGDLLLVTGADMVGHSCFVYERDVVTGQWTYQYRFPTTYGSNVALEGNLAAGRDADGIWVASRSGAGFFQERYSEPIPTSPISPAGGPDIEHGAIVFGAQYDNYGGRVYVYQDLSCAGGIVRTHTFSTAQKALASFQDPAFGLATELSNGRIYGGLPDLSELGSDMSYKSGAVGVFDLLLDCNGNGIPDHCDIAAGEPDIDLDGIPDTCDQIGLRYCSPNAIHSGNVSAVLTVEGSANALSADVRLSMIALPEEKFGLFLAGRNLDSVPMAGGSLGTLCVGAPLARMQSPYQGHSGLEGRINLTIDTQAIPLSTGVSAILPGETWFFQGWFRDAGGSGFTDAMSVSFF